MKTKKTRTYSTDDIRKKIDGKMRAELLSLKNAKIAITPFGKINASRLQEIVDSAIWRTGPFKEKNEGEGFRDAIILETVRDYCEVNKHTDVIFLTNDTTLQQAASELATDKIKNLIPLKEFEAVNNYVEAGLKFNPDFLHEVLRKAEKTLFTPEKSAFGRSIIEELINKHKLQKGEIGFEKNPGSLVSAMYRCEGNNAFYTLGTTFLSVVGETSFHFKTTIAVVSDYSGPSGPFNLGGNSRRERTMFFDVEWEVTVNPEKKFTKFRLLQDDLIHEVYKEPLAGSTNQKVSSALSE